VQGRDIWARIHAIPAPARPVVGALMRTIPVGAWNTILSLVPAHLTPGQKGRTMHWLAGNLMSGNFNELFHRLVSIWDAPETLVLGAREAKSPVWDGERQGDTVERMMYLDSVTYLPDDILAKLDRASMAFSLEARDPLLDHRLFDFAWRLPVDYRVRGDKGKWLLRQVLGRYVPPELTERPKQGFSLPIGDWLRGPLRGWAEDLLSETRLAEDGMLNPAAVGTAWKGLLKGNSATDARIWSVLMFQAWRARW
jgi:asparagine synthase (glutamine-hydrolysing)